MNYTANIGIGDLLFRTKFPFVNHKGVVVGNGLVCHNTPERGEHLSTVQEFTAGQPVRVQRTGANPADVVSRANKVLADPKKYNPAFRNCEHTASEIIYGIAKSPFVLTALSILLIAGLLVWLFRR